MNKKNMKNLLLVIYIFWTLLFCILVRKIEIFNNYSLVIKITYSVLTLVVIQYIIYIITKYKPLEINQYISLFCYMLIILITLYYRKSLRVETASNKFYLGEWLKIMLVNKTVFLNIIGNIIIFIPLGIFFKQFTLKDYIKIIIMISIVILLEVIQYLSKKGIFDYIDILLNIIGSLMGYICIKKEGKKIEKGIIKRSC